MFRRGGTVVPFLIDGSLPDPRDDAFLEALAEQRFRTIETSSSEESSVGWATQADPTGDSFEREELEMEGYLWLRLRMDKKVLPAAWLKIYKVSAQRAAGRKLTAQENRDLRDDLMRKLLPRVLPSVRLIDVALYPERKLAFLFGGAKAVQDEFVHLFYRTFGVSPLRADPYNLANWLDIGTDHKEYLNEVSPVDWGRFGSPSLEPGSLS